LSRPVAYLCDFDGTIAPSDVGARFARRFATDDGAVFRALEPRWRSGELGHRELTEAECAVLRVSADEAAAFVRSFTIDPHFARFVRAAEARGDAVMVVSEGFDFYIAALLQAAGLGALPLAANRLRFEGGAAFPEFPHPTPSCVRCGNCKAQHVRAFTARGYRTVMVGDGYSDRCGARAADKVLARGGLREWCAREGIAAHPFEDFSDVAAWAGRSNPDDAVAAAGS
jgi:2,3-diketo-5-methylthio-1-phosphopentane phosphatase